MAHAALALRCLEGECEHRPRGHESARLPACSNPDYSARSSAVLSMSKALATEFSPASVPLECRPLPGWTRTPYDRPRLLWRPIAEALGTDRETSRDQS